MGAPAVLGGAVWDVQHKFRIEIGPLRWQRFAELLPGRESINRLRALVRIRLIAGFGVAAESLTRQALDAFKQTELIHTHQ